MTDIKTNYTENAFEGENLPKRETVRYYEVPDNLRDFKELTKGMNAADLLKLKRHIEKEIFRKIGN